MKGNNQDCIDNQIINSGTNPGAVIVLEERLGTLEAARLYNHLLMLTSQGHAVVIDCSRTIITDITILQIVLSFVWQINRNGQRVVWENPSASFWISAELLGMEKHVALKSVPVPA